MDLLRHSPTKYGCRLYSIKLSMFDLNVHGKLIGTYIVKDFFLLFLLINRRVQYFVEKSHREQRNAKCTT